MSLRTRGRQDALLGNIEPERKILVAVDFGTTFSGLAWAQTRKPDLQTPIIQWPDATSGGLEGITSDKVPTEIQYDGENFKWGFQIGDLGQRYQWFKLDLDPSQLRGTSSLANKFPDPAASPPGYDTPPEKLATDYLTALRKHAEQVLRYKLPASALQSTPIEFIITVPAVWSDGAQAKTRACAEQAGMGSGSSLHIISEPEAAAMYALDVMDPHNIQIGDTFVLCDAGGGTVDLISYTVSELRPILKIVEASPGSGMLCGSSFLNRIFQRFLETTLSGEPNWDADVLEEAMKRFESTIKRQYRGTSGEEFLIPVPGLSDNAYLGIRRGRLTLSGDEVKTIFDPVVQEVTKLVKGQIEASRRPIKAVLMVGGFGQNAYLRDCIRQSLAGSNIEIMQSPNGWTAVVRGALMKGLASTSPTFASVRISGRSARKHYGISSQKMNIEDLHPDSRRYWSNFHSKWMVSTMDWFIKKGSIVEEEKPTRLPYFKTFLHSKGHPRMVTIDILVSSDPANTGAAKYSDDVGVNKLLEVQADLSKIPANLLLSVRGDDFNLYYKVSFEVEITYYSAFTKYELIYNDKNYGPVAAEYV